MTSALWQAVPFTSESSGSMTATPPVTVPDGSGGKVARFFAEWNNAGTVTPVDPAGWDREPAGELNNNGSVLGSAMWKRTLQPTDDLTTVSVAFTGGSVRCSGVLLVFDEGEDDQTVTTTQTTTGAANQTIPASTTADASSLVVAVLGLASPAATGVAQPSGWTEAVDAWTTNASGNRHGTWVGVRNTRVAASAATSSATAVAADAGTRSNGYTVLISDAPVLPDVAPGAGWRFGSLAMRS